jgi:uncharacterized membrane protein YfcA
VGFVLLGVYYGAKLTTKVIGKTAYSVVGIILMVLVGDSY